MPLKGMLYALFGHHLIKGGHDALFFKLSITGIFSFVLLFSMWFEKNIPRKCFLCLIIILSLFQTSSIIDFKHMDGLFIEDDYPKYYSITVENANLLIRYGTPFGFNHSFQGGIPTLDPTGCFLELIPFSFFFGDQSGYQVMLIFFIVLAPITLFFFISELTKNEDIAKLVSFMASAFQLGAWPFLYCGMTPTIAAMPLSFLTLFFFLKYLYNKKRFYFPLLVFSSLLGYTHLLIFVITLMFSVIIFLYKLITQKEVYADFKKLTCFSLLSFLAVLPLYYNLFSYQSFLNACGGYFKEKTLFDYVFSVFHNLAINNTALLLSMLFVFCLYFRISNPKERLKLRNALAFSLFIWVLLSLKDIPKMQDFVERIAWTFTPYIVVFNLSLFLLLKINKKAKIFGIIAILFIVFYHYSLPLLRTKPLETIDSISEIDSEISIFISPQDFVLFENCAHLNPERGEVEFVSCSYGHWLTYLQRYLGVKFFSHIGNDPHPFNNLRDMYISNGLYKRAPLGKDNEKEFIARLKDWGVNKVCVWSSIAKRFFDSSGYFKLLGESKKYRCYIATYDILPQIRLNKGGTGTLIDETPFSFTVRLENVSENQTVTINKNYFNFWSAYNERGDKIPLRNCHQKIGFDIANNGYIFFKYRKNILLNLISLLTLFVTLITDILRRIGL